MRRILGVGDPPAMSAPLKDDDATAAVEDVLRLLWKGVERRGPDGGWRGGGRPVTMTMHDVSSRRPCALAAMETIFSAARSQ
eukprot:CAMPEP_0206173392 /NCGR_PEP_ID=MMETSP1474-20131121/48732_1 /ASSEMBLY_ACC=CAM_ASM_001110 /TAXON_ID=97495 /ORGANISM="Imantonia sp., Strain RCC918" /LENGTH=81 /DNA_ID=CAMNT_0053582209 /DNA_START=387 /DNA_END=629 /DNA_ORIENTATION=+